MLQWMVDRYVKREYIRVELDGSVAIVAPIEACEYLAQSDDAELYKVSSVFMTKNKFESVEEFLGF